MFVLDAIIQTPNQVFASLFGLATLLPEYAVMFRRIHDTDFRGWWLLLGLVPLVGQVVLIASRGRAATTASIVPQFRE